MNLARTCLLMVCAGFRMAVAQTTATDIDRHLQAAKQAQAAQNCAVAAKEYAAAARLVPTSGELRTNQGIALYCDQQYAATRDALQKALALNPKLTVPHLFLGLALFHLSDDRAAIRELETAAKDMPNDVTSRLWLGFAYMNVHESERAETSFADVLKLQPDNVDALYALGQSYFEAGRQSARQLVTAYPKGRGIRMLVAQQGSAKASGETQNPLPDWTDANEEALYRQASDSEQKAQEVLQQVMDKYPASDRAHQIQGDIASLQRNNDAAVAQYAEVLRMNPTLPGVRLAMANCLMQLSQFDRALDVLRQEERLTPRSPEVLTSMGRVQLSLGSDAEAIRAFEAAIRLPQSPAAAHLLLGKALLRTGDAKGAVLHLEQALHQGADPATTNYLLARAYRVTGDHAAMARSLEAYRRFSQDETEREAAAAITQGPASVPTAMTAQETQEASNLSTQSPIH